jgi:hypothetical protein
MAARNMTTASDIQAATLGRVRNRLIPLLFLLYLIAFLDLSFAKSPSAARSLRPPPIPTTAETRSQPIGLFLSRPPTVYPELTPAAHVAFASRLSTYAA